jgi:hypothetical protein
VSNYGRGAGSSATRSRRHRSCSRPSAARPSRRRDGASWWRPPCTPCYANRCKPSPAGSKVRRRNRPCLGRPRARILLGRFPHLRGVPSPHLRGTHLHSPRTHLHISADPLFPATLVSQGSNDHFAASGIARAHWASADAVRKIFREAFEGIGLHGFNPHSFRHALALLAERKCRTPEEFKAWSQNLGHESVLTTFSSYGTLLEHRQADVIKSLKEPGARPTIQRRCCVVSPNWFKAPHCRTSLNFNQASYPHATVGRHSTLLQDLTSRLNVGPTQGRGRYFPSRAARGSTYRKATCGAASRLRLSVMPFKVADPRN